MGFSQFWLTMADKEIKVHHRVIRMIFPMIQRAKNERSVRRALPVYDNGNDYVDIVVQKRLQKAANFTVGWPSHPLNVNNTKIYQIILAMVYTEDNYPLPQQFRGKSLTRRRTEGVKLLQGIL